LTKFFVQKRIGLVPKVTYCIVLEMVYMFAYVVLTVTCRHSFSSIRSHISAWIGFLFYFFFWGKLSYSFLATFGRIVRDTKVSGDQPIEECYTLAFMSLATLLASFVTFYLTYDAKGEGSLVIYYSFLYLFGAAIMSWHAKLLRDFHTEPTVEDLKKS